MSLDTSEHIAYQGHMEDFGSCLLVSVLHKRSITPARFQNVYCCSKDGCQMGLLYIR